MSAARKSIATNDRRVTGHCEIWLCLKAGNRLSDRLAAQFGNQLRHVIISCGNF